MSAPPDTDLPCEWAPSPNFGPRRPESGPARRADMLILHYTAMASAERALHWLTTEESVVSSHYLIDETGKIFQMVREADRAWHAGMSSWQGAEDINSASIGIEIHNMGADGGCPDYPDVQMTSVVALCRDIVARNAIPQTRVLAHSDVSPGRKIDPGPHFDWKALADAGVGLWPKRWSQPGRVDVPAIQRQLADIGYGIDITGEDDAQTRTVVSAFQLRWRPSCHDGELDAQTAARIGDVWQMMCAVA
ncbi:MAG: N-acetylmuramoyl-L-alanine amidase [Hyphomicrobiaceae bacterium]